MTTTARRDGDIYVLNGPKIWISLADIADHFLVFATVDRAQEAQGHHRVRARARAWRASRPAPSTASWASRPATPALIYLDDVRVPVENRIGEEGEGFTIAMSAIDQGRFTVAAGAVGLAQACLDASVRYAHERHTFGEEIGDHQLVKQMIAKMGQGIEAGRLLVLAGGVAQEPRPAQHARDEPGQVVLPPSTRSSARSTPSRSTAPTATPTSSRSSATCATARPRSSTRAPASCTRSSRPTTCSAIARTGRCAASRCRRRASSARRHDRGGGRRPRPPDAGWAGRSASSRPSRARRDVRPGGDADRRARPRGRGARRRAADPVAARPAATLVLRPASSSRSANLASAVTGALAAFRDDDARGPRALPPRLGRLAHAAAPLGIRRVPQAADLPRLRGPGPSTAPNPRLARDRATDRDDPPVAAEPTPIAPLVSPVDDGAPDDAAVTLDADAVVVGSGAGGGVVAAELARGRPVASSSSRPDRSSTKRRCRATSSMPSTASTSTTACSTTWDGVDHDAGRDGRRRRHARQLDDLHRGPEEPSATSGRATTASTGVTGDRVGQPTSPPSSASSASPSRPHIPPKDEVILRGAARARLGGRADAPERDATAATAAAVRSAVGAAPSSPGIRVHLADGRAAGARDRPGRAGSPGSCSRAAARSA